MSKPEYMTTAQAAADLDCTTDWIRKLVRAGRVRATTFGPMWAILTADLEKVRNLPQGRPPTKGKAKCLNHSQD